MQHRGEPHTRYLIVCGPESPLSGKITWRVTQPQREPKTDEEAREKEKLEALMDRIRKTVEARAKGRKE